MPKLKDASSPLCTQGGVNSRQPEHSNLVHQDGTSVKSMQWPGGEPSSSIAAHRSNKAHPASALKPKSAYAAPTLPLHKVSKPSSSPSPSPTNLPPSLNQSPNPMPGPQEATRQSPRVMPGSQEAAKESPKQSPRLSARRIKHAWDAEPSLVNILSQSTPHRPWSAGGYAGRPELDTVASEGQMLPGTLSWYSPKNHIGVHPESLLYHRDPEQLAEDVIGLANRNADLTAENRLAKVQINKLSTSLSHERAEADQLSEVLGITSPRRPYTPTAGSRPTSPRLRPSSSRPLNSRPGTAGAMPDWMLSDLQQRLNSAQHMLTQQSMLHSQHRMTWPRPASPSSNRRGARPLHSHISLHPDSRLADAFATYGVPRGISQYMSKKWGRASPRGSTAGTHTKADALSSSDMAAVLREKVVAVSKASHMILLEAVQLRAHFPPVTSAEESARLQPQLDALIEILHTHCIQVQTELSMLPAEALKNLVASHHPEHQAQDMMSPFQPQQLQSSLSETEQDAAADPAAPFSASSSQQDTDLMADLEAEEAAAREAEKAAEGEAEEEEELQPAADEAESTASADAGEQKGDETSASLEFESTAGNAAEPSNGSQDGRHEEEEESQQAEDDEHGSLLWSSQHAEEEEATPQIQGHEDDASADDPQIEAELRATNASSNVVSHLGNRAEQTLSQRPGSGMMDEYLKRMHWSRSSPLPTQSSNTGEPGAVPPQAGSSASISSAQTLVDVVTYDDSAADHVAPVSAESAQAAFEQAGQNSFVRREDAVHPEMHIAADDAADSPEAESAGMSEPTQAETQEAESAQAEVEEPVGSSQDEFEEPAEPTQDISEELAESSHGAREEPIAELNQDIQPAREDDSEVESDAYEEVFEDADMDLESQPQPDSQAESALPSEGFDQFVSSASNPLYGPYRGSSGNHGVILADKDDAAVVDASMKCEMSDDAVAAVDRNENGPAVSLNVPEGRSEQPFTPTASPALFSPTDNATGGVDAVSTTPNPHPVKPDHAMPHQGLSRVRSGLRAAPDAHADLTPSYRHQVRSMGQVTDNDYPFKSTIPRQSAVDVVSQPSSQHGTESFSRQSSIGAQKLSRSPSAGISRQASMTKPASLAPSSRQASFGGNKAESAVVSKQAGTTASSSQASSPITSRQPSRQPSRQASNVSSVVVGRQASNVALADASSPSGKAVSPVIIKQPSMRSSNVGSAVSRQPSNAASAHQSKVASPAVSRQPSMQMSHVGSASTGQQSSIAVPVLSKRPSNAGTLSKQPSSASGAAISRQSSSTSDRQASNAASAAVSRQPSTAASVGLSKQPSSVPSLATSRQPSTAASVALHHEGSSPAMHAVPGVHALPAVVSRQPSYATSAGPIQEGSYAVAGSFSKQSSCAPLVNISQESSDAVAAKLSRHGSGALSKQPSYTPSGLLSKEGSFAATGPLSKQPSYIPMPNPPANPSSCRASLGARMLRETSQVLVLEGSDWELTNATLAGDESSGGKAWRETSQPEFIEADDDWQPPSEPVSSEISEKHPSQSAKATAGMSESASRQLSYGAADPANSAPASWQPSVVGAAADSRAVSRQASLIVPDSSASLPASKVVSRQQSLKAAAAVINSNSPAGESRTASRQPSIASNAETPGQGRAISRQPSASTRSPVLVSRAASMSSSGNNTTPKSKTVPHQQPITDAVHVPVASRPPSRQPSMTGSASPAANVLSQQPFVTAAAPVSNLDPKQPSAVAATTTAAPITASHRVPSKQSSAAVSAQSPDASTPVSRQPSVTANTAGAPLVKSVSRQPSLTASSNSPALFKSVSRQASVTSEASNAAAPAPTRLPSRQSSSKSTSSMTSQPVSGQGSVTASASAAPQHASVPAFTRVPSKQLASDSISHHDAEPFTGPRGVAADDSLAAMHRQLSTSRKATAGATSTLIPNLKTQSSVQGGIHGPSRHPSITPSKADDIPKSVVRQNSTASSAAASADGFVPAMHEDDMPDVSHFETSHDIESATAHEKHAYLHSQHGLEDVFECC